MAAVLALAVAAPAGDLRPGGAPVAATSIWADAAALIQSRSPGLRRIVEYVKGKRAVPAARARPRPRPRRAVASVRPPFVPTVPPPAALPLVLSDLPLTPGPAEVAFAPPPPVAFVDLSPIVPPNLPVPRGFVFIGGGGGPGGPGLLPPPPGPPGPPPPGPPGIPEPSSWTTMILGFAVLGWLWRRRRLFLRLLTYVPVLRLAMLPVTR